MAATEAEHLLMTRGADLGPDGAGRTTTPETIERLGRPTCRTARLSCWQAG